MECRMKNDRQDSLKLKQFVKTPYIGIWISCYDFQNRLC